MTGTPTYPIHGAHFDPVCSRAFSTSMLFNNSIISVGSQAPTLDNRAQRPTERYSTVRLVLKGVKRWRPRSERHRLPITPYILNTMLTVLLQNPQEYNNIMLWAACCLGFFAFLRSGEFTAPASTFDPTWHLSPQDILVDSHATPSMLEIKIKGSKTDQTRRGVSLFVGRTHNCLCPVTAILAYLAVRGTSPGC